MHSNSYVYKFIQQLLENLSGNVEHYLFVKHYNTITLTEEMISALIASTDYTQGCDLNETLKHADEALYYVKKHEKRTYRVWNGM